MSGAYPPLPWRQLGTLVASLYTLDHDEARRTVPGDVAIVLPVLGSVAGDRRAFSAKGRMRVAPAAVSWRAGSGPASLLAAREPLYSVQGEFALGFGDVRIL